MEPGTEKALDIITEKLDKITSEKEKYCYIYRVYDHLRNLNKQAYEPEILAIGPYHHDTPNTKLMEKHKLFYLKSLLHRKNESVKTYLSAIEEIEQEARKCYDHHINFGSAEFISMMLIDGCFIIELLQKYATIFLEGKKGDSNFSEVADIDDNPSETCSDDIFDTEWMLGSIKRDLMLFENQIPFFVLQKLFYLIESQNPRHSLSKLLFEFFKTIIPDKVGYEEINVENTLIIHLLDLIYTSWIPSSSTSQVTYREGRVKFINSATKLRDANVNFEKHDSEVSLFDVKFKNGTLKMTPLRIADRTEALFRNLIAYEQYFPGEINFVTDYVKFLDCLIDFPGDVEILREHKILDNWLGTDKVVSDIFIKLTDSIFIPDSISYVEVYDQVNEHCKKRRNKWMATLRRNHLSSPWAILSIVAAVILLLLTTVQTVCSILQL